MKLFVASCLAALVAATTYAASAAVLGGIVTSDATAGDSAIARCDTDGFTVGYTLVSSYVTSVTVYGIADPGCERAAVSVTLTNSAGTSIGSGTGTVPTDAGTSDNSMIVAVAPTPAETNVVGIHLSFRGP